MIYVVALSEGYYGILWVNRAEADLQDRVEQFQAVKKRYPASIDELRQDDSMVAPILARIKAERVLYEVVGDHDYRLTFKRTDRGDAEDRTATHKFQLRPILDKVEKESPIP
jgi:hypothetical protein